MARRREAHAGVLGFGEDPRQVQRFDAARRLIRDLARQPVELRALAQDRFQVGHAGAQQRREGDRGRVGIDDVGRHAIDALGRQRTHQHGAVPVVDGAALGVQLDGLGVLPEGLAGQPRALANLHVEQPPREERADRRDDVERRFSAARGDARECPRCHLCRHYLPASPGAAVSHVFIAPSNATPRAAGGGPGSAGSAATANVCGSCIPNRAAICARRSRDSSLAI